MDRLFRNNREWSSRVRRDDPEFFESLSRQQSPRYLWIGCSDSRVPANEIVGLQSGEIFVHRNVGNLVQHTDFNCLSVVQYAVEILKVRHIMITGHYGCGGISAALRPTDLDLIDNWLHSVCELARDFRDFLNRAPDDSTRVDWLCELNVLKQVRILCENAVIRHAWLRGQELTVHGCIYGLRDGVLNDLGTSMSSLDSVEPTAAAALDSLLSRA